MTKRRRTILVGAALALSTCAAGACGLAVFKLLLSQGLSIAPGSRDYVPASEREAAAMRTARRDVYPGDVLQHLEEHAGHTVAWAGVIRAFTVSEEAGQRVLRFDVEHRYFDWIEDQGIQPERFFLSPRGEGNFRVAWPAPPRDLGEPSELIQVGDMLVSYGRPSLARDGVVGLYPVVYVRLIARSFYADDVLDYGRASGVSVGSGRP